MAKKQEIVESKELIGLDKDLVKKYKDVIVDGQWIMDSKPEVFSISPALDMALGGGVPEGSWVIFSGKEKAGKTMTGLHLMSKYQQAGRLCFYINIEGRLKCRDLAGIPGLNPNTIKVVSSSEGNILGGEDFVNIVSNIIKAHPKAYILMDSTSALCSSKELTEDITATGRVLGPRILAAFCRQNGGVVPIQKTTIVMIQHLIANTSGYGASQYEDGGRKVKYQGDIHLRCTTFDTWVDKDNVQIGQVPTWEVKYSALGAPGIKVKSWIRYGGGIDEVMEIIEIACNFGLISKGGAWYTMDFIENAPKLNGQEKTHAFLKENPEHFKTLYDKVMGILK